MSWPIGSASWRKASSRTPPACSSGWQFSRPLSWAALVFQRRDRSRLAGLEPVFLCLQRAGPAKSPAKPRIRTIWQQSCLVGLEAVADMNVGEGAALLYSDRAEAKKRLEAAKEGLPARSKSSGDPMLKTRAQLGLGKVYESLCDPDKAREYYEKVAASEKDSAIGKAAAADAKRMKDSREVEFLGLVRQADAQAARAISGRGRDNVRDSQVACQTVPT